MSNTALQPKNRFTQLAKKVIDTMVIPELHFTKLIGGEFISRREQILWESREIEEQIASDVERNTDGNDNKFGKSTEKMITGVEFHEKLNINEILTSLVGFGQADYEDSGLKSEFAREVMRRMEIINDKFVRAIEKASAQFFKSGVVTYKTRPTGFDFNRPATAIVDVGAAQYWSNNTADIKQQVMNDITYFRATALFNGGEFDWTMSSQGYTKLIENDFFDKEKKQISYSAIQLVAPRFNAGGATYMGSFEVAGRIIHMWVYDGQGKGASTGGSSLERYMPSEYVVKTPRNMNIGEVTYFPIDSASAAGKTGLPQPVFGKRHTWDEMKMGSDTLVKHIKSRWNVIAYYEKHVKTDQILAST